MNVPFYDLARVEQPVAKEIRKAKEKVDEHKKYILGPEVEEFEKAFANYCGTEHCISVDSGLSALELSLIALGITPGDEVITVPNTFFATASAISGVGAKPVLVDVNEDTCLMNPGLVEDAITRKTIAILPVHLYGQTVDMNRLWIRGNEHNLPILEDACQAHGAKYGDMRAGNLGDIAAFSFYPGKNLGCHGDGGAVTTNSDKLAKIVRMHRDYGQDGKYNHVVMGGNHRLDTIQAAVLLAKLPMLDEWNAQRRGIAKAYEEGLFDINEIKLPHTGLNAGHVYHQYVIQVPDREKFMANMKEKGVGTAVHYPLPIHLQPAFKHLGYKKGDFPVSEHLCEHVVSLPMFPGMNTDEVDYVIEAVRDSVSKK